MGDPSVCDMVDAINERSCIYEILFRNAGVGILFFEGPPGTPMDRDGAWRKHLVVHKYYPSFEECIRAEYARLVSDHSGSEDKR